MNTWNKRRIRIQRIKPNVKSEQLMPVILRVKRYQFYFFSNEGNEPEHIHVKAGGDQAKFWLEPIGLASNYGFNSKELNEIEKIIRKNQALLMEKWNEYLSKT